MTNPRLHLQPVVAPTPTDTCFMMTLVAQPPPAPDPTSPNARRADREIRGYLAMRTQRRRVYPRAALLGLVTGGVAVAFRWCLEAGDQLTALISPGASGAVRQLQEGVG